MAKEICANIAGLVTKTRPDKMESNKWLRVNNEPVEKVYQLYFSIVKKVYGKKNSKKKKDNDDDNLSDSMYHLWQEFLNINCEISKKCKPKIKL